MPVRPLVALSLMLCSGAALANDSTAELGTGGIRLARSDVISLDRENLFISMDKVTVDYVFTNSSDADVDTIVAFPMPDIEMYPDAMIAIPDTASDNFLGFTVEMDGKAIAPELQQRALANKVDITNILKAAGVPLLAVSEEAQAALDSLSDAAKADLRARGAIEIQSWDAGNGMEDHAVPLWTLQSVYWWRATFPAGRSVTVHHDYVPSVGGTAGVYFTESDVAAREYSKTYCMDDAFIKAAKRKVDGGRAAGRYYTEQRISYVLSSGSNWYGPIREFNLTIDKGDTDNLVSFCGEGVSKTGPTTFTMKKKDYYPEEDLHLLFVTGGSG